MSWTKHYEANGVLMCEFADDYGTYMMVSDTVGERYRVTIAMRGERFSIGINAEWNSDKPGALACYTPRYEHGSCDCTQDEIAIDDTGLLTVMARQNAAAHVDVRMGFTVQLPPEYVPPIRQAMAILAERMAVVELVK